MRPGGVCVIIAHARERDIPGVIATTVYLCYLLFVVVYKLVMFMEHG